MQLSEHVLTSQLSTICLEMKERAKERRAIGIQSSVPWQGAEILSIGEEKFFIRQCEGELEMRETLLDGAGAAAVPVIVTGKRSDEVAEDIRARIWKGRLEQSSPWDIVRHLFKASSIDPALKCEPAVAEALLSVPQEEIPPVAMGLLSADAGWDVLWRSYFGLSGDKLSFKTLLAASLDPRAVQQIEQAPEPLKAALVKQLSSIELGEIAGRYIEHNCFQELFVSGLGVSVLTGASGQTASVGRALFEHQFKINIEQPAERAVRWGKVTAEVFEAKYDSDKEKFSRIAREAEKLLRDELRSAALLEESEVLPGAVELLLEEQGRALKIALSDGELDEEAICRIDSRLRRHFLFRKQDEETLARAEQINWATRLTRFVLGTDFQDSFALGSLGAQYLNQIGFVDLGRKVLTSRQERSALLSSLYTELAKRLSVFRESVNERFGTEVGKAFSNSSADGLVLLENVFSSVVGPILSEAPVLVIVVDGMSIPIYYEVAENLESRRWGLLRSDSSPENATVLALTLLPSVTQVARCSLFSGRVCSGGQSEELRGFAAHPGLSEHGKKQPLLFHKDALFEPESRQISETLRRAIGDAAQRVVGCVINAVDDHLLKGDQVSVCWGVDSIVPLKVLLELAEKADRVVVILSDHGHVVERGSKFQRYDEGERCRSASGECLPGEVRVEGKRVVYPGGAIIVPWSESLRYSSAKKNGYHGGASPQEMLVPVGVFRFAPEQDYSLGDLKLSAIKYPDWYEPIAVQSKKTGKKKTPGQLSFADKPQPLVPYVAGAADWIAQLLASPVYRAQQTRVSRMGISEEHVVAFLECVMSRGGKVLEAALGQRLSLPAFRVRGFIHGMKKLLNVDGYQVLRIEEASGDVELNIELLKEQFGV